jgi:hypothetical protein
MYFFSEIRRRISKNPLGPHVSCPHISEMFGWKNLIKIRQRISAEEKYVLFGFISFANSDNGVQ